MWPRLWLVPICSALPSCISASQVNVWSAPAKRSPGDFSPATTEIASVSSMNARYTSSMRRVSSAASA